MDKGREILEAEVFPGRKKDGPRAAEVALN